MYQVPTKKKTKEQLKEKQHKTKEIDAEKEINQSKKTKITLSYQKSFSTSKYGLCHYHEAQT